MLDPQVASILLSDSSEITEMVSTEGGVVGGGGGRTPSGPAATEMQLTGLSAPIDAFISS